MGCNTPSYFLIPSPLLPPYSCQFSTLFPVPDFKQFPAKPPELKTLTEEKEGKKPGRLCFKTSFFILKSENQRCLQMYCLELLADTVNDFTFEVKPHMELSVLVTQAPVRQEQGCAVCGSHPLIHIP